MKYFISTIVVIGTAIVAWQLFINNPNEGNVACPADALQCPDGSYVGRQGPNCEFADCPSSPVVEIPDDLASHIASKAHLIELNTPTPLMSVNSPIVVSGQARGYWFFEASFPIVVVNWDGLIIGEGYATAESDWMTEDFVPFSAEISYDLPADSYSNRGALILRRDNPSGLPENDDALEIPIILN